MTFAANPPGNTFAYAVTYFDSMYLLVGNGDNQILQMLNN